MLRSTGRVAAAAKLPVEMPWCYESATDKRLIAALVRPLPVREPNGTFRDPLSADGSAARRVLGKRSAVLGKAEPQHQSVRRRDPAVFVFALRVSV